MTTETSLTTRLLAGDPSPFEATTARHALKWLCRLERYLGDADVIVSSKSGTTIETQSL